MPVLASCYFCGEGVDASLQEHDLPDGAPADEQVSVTLCAGCHGKLSALLAELDLAGGSGAEEPVVQSDVTATARPEASPSTDASEPASTDRIASESASPEDASDQSAASSASDVVAGEGEPIFAEDEDAVLDEDLPRVDEGAADEPFAGPERDGTADEPVPQSAGDSASESGDDGSADGPESGDARASSSPDDPESDPAPSTTGESSDGDDADRDPSPVGADSSGSGTASRRASRQSGNATDGGGDDDGPLAGVSPRTYNRVVRLLQNRELPVDRDDFEALASSAYELDPEECAAVLDGTIEKGLLVERDGELRRPT